MHNDPVEPGLEPTEPGNRGKCFFCPGHEDGYAMTDKDGKFRPTCYKCLRKAHPPVDYPQVRRKQVGTVFTEDLDSDEAIALRDKTAKRAAKKAAKAVDEVAPEVPKEQHDNVPDSKVHNHGAKLAPSKRPAVQRRKVGANG